MTKKKNAVVYVPISQDIPNTQSQNLSVPDYEDRGIQYKGYAKIPIGGGEFRLKKQETRFISFIHNNAAGTQLTTIRPNKSTHIFYCTNITLSWREGALGAYKYLIFYDDNVNNPKWSTWLQPSTTLNLSVDLTSCPRMFVGDIVTTVPSAFDSGNQVFITMTGFDEEI